MAGPSVVVRVLGDLSGLSKSFTDAGTKGESAASRMKGAFNGMLGTLNQTGVLGPFSGALAGVQGSIDAIGEHGKRAGVAMMGVGTAVAGAGAALSAMGSKDQAAHQQLQAAVQATGKDYEDYAGQIEKTIKHQENYAHSAAETQDALRVLTEAFGDPQKALDEMGLAANLAAAKHESLTEASTQLGKVANGSTRLLKEFGLSQKDAAGHALSHDQILQALSQRLSGQAAAAADTFKGKLDALKTRGEDLVATYGQKFGPAVTAAGTAMAGLGAVMEIASAASLATLGPILLVVAAVAALVAIGIVVYKNWDTIWGFIKSVVMDVWNWIKTNWPLLLGILLGPIGVAAALIIKNWDTIKAAAADAVNFVIGVWNGLYGFFAGLVNDVKNIFDKVWGGIKDAFKDVINAVIDIWNDLHFTLPKVDILGVHIGGETIGVPQIPHMAGGGIVTSPTLAMIGESGPEAVVPLGRGGPGPVMVIQHATFNDPVDVELLTKKIAFALSAGLPV